MLIHLSRFHAYIRNACFFIKEYSGEVPLAIGLKQYFSTHKKFGSNDRKQISNLCFQYYRLGHWLKELEIEDRILLAHFLCTQGHSSILETLKPEWLLQINLTLNDKLEFLKIPWLPENHTYWFLLIQEGIDCRLYVESLFQQPNLFLRIRPGFEKKVAGILKVNQILETWHKGHSLCLPNGTAVQNMLAINQEVAVQDYSSQQTIEYLHQWLPDFTGKVWDACAASGGKSIQLSDIYKSRIRLTVSDIRVSILKNLHERFQLAGIKKYDSFVLDLTHSSGMFSKKESYDLILADVPCTGSGTWARTPEQHVFFDPSTLKLFTDRQLKICLNLVSCLKPGGYFVYITCSVFESENNGIVMTLLENTSLQLVHSKVICGIENKADSMFIALLQKP